MWRTIFHDNRQAVKIVPIKLAVISVIVMATLLTALNIKRDQLRWEIVAIGSHDRDSWGIMRAKGGVATRRVESADWLDIIDDVRLFTRFLSFSEKWKRPISTVPRARAGQNLIREKLAWFFTFWAQKRRRVQIILRGNWEVIWLTRLPICLCPYYHLLGVWVPLRDVYHGVSPTVRNRKLL